VLWILTAGVTQTLSLALKGKGSYTDTLNMAGIMIFTPFVFIDTIDTAFFLLNAGNWSMVFNSVTRTAYVLWSVVLLSIGLIVVHELRLFKSILIAIVTTALSVFVNIIFIR
jgi:hypothetical protein